MSRAAHDEKLMKPKSLNPLQVMLRLGLNRKEIEEAMKNGQEVSAEEVERTRGGCTLVGPCPKRPQICQ